MDNIWADRSKVKENKKRKVQKDQADLSENLLSLERAGGLKIMGSKDNGVRA